MRLFKTLDCGFVVIVDKLRTATGLQPGCIIWMRCKSARDDGLSLKQRWRPAEPRAFRAPGNAHWGVAGAGNAHFHGALRGVSLCQQPIGISRTRTPHEPEDHR